MAQYRFIRSSGVRSLVKEADKRCGADFLAELNLHVYETVCRCIKLFNGHKKTLDRTSIQVITGKIKV